MTDINEEDIQTAYMLGRHDGCKDAERDQSWATAHGTTQRIENDLAHAQLQFSKCRESAVNATLAGDGFYEHNEASYWKGRRDALRNLLSNVESAHGERTTKV